MYLILGVYEKYSKIKNNSSKKTNIYFENKLIIVMYPVQSVKLIRFLYCMDTVSREREKAKQNNTASFFIKFLFLIHFIKK
jgi:hypothetical protein